MKRTESVGAGVLGYFVLACAVTWACATPLVLAWSRHEAPSDLAMACAGLSAFGPLLAVLVFGLRQRRLRDVFGRWRTHVGWIVLALALPIALRTLSVAVYAVLGGEPSAWFYPPGTPEQVAAMVVFPLGEEFGWRGEARFTVFLDAGSGGSTDLDVYAPASRSRLADACPPGAPGLVYAVT